MSGPLWTTIDRRALGIRFDQSRPDLHAAAGIARDLVAALARHFPSRYRSVEILPLLVHKLAGYNADLFGHARRLLRSAAAADAYLAERPAESLVFPFGDQYLAEHAIAERIRARGGAFVALDDAVQSTEALRTRYAPRSQSPGFERCEFSLPDDCTPAPAMEGAATSASTATGARTTLFLASMNNYLQPMIPVMAEMTRRGQRVALVTPRAGGSWPLAPALPRGLERVFLEDLFSRELHRSYSENRARAAERWSRSVADVRASFRPLGIDLWPLVERDIERFILDYVPACELLIDAAERLAAALRPGACVVSRLRRATECVMTAAWRRAGVPLTMLVHGHISNFPERSFDTGSFDAERVCVWGEAQKRQALNADRAPRAEQVIVTGNPAWDGLIASGRDGADRTRDRASLAGDLGLVAARPWAVLTAQDITAPWFIDVVRAFALEPRVALIVKPHPAESPDWYRRRCAELPGSVVLEHGRADLHALLRAADLTLTFSSTTNLESLILGTPVVTYAFGDLANQDRAAYLEECGLPLARTPDELADILRRLAADAGAFRGALAGAVERSLRAFVGNYPSGDGARRAADVILGTAARPTLAGAA